MVLVSEKWELLVEYQNWTHLKAKVLAHLENGLQSSPFELYGRSDKLYGTNLFSGNFSILGKR